MIHVNLSPTDRQLRQFGFTALLVLPLLAWLFGMPHYLGATAVIGAAMALAAMVTPALVKPIYIALTVAVLPIGLVVGELMMLLIYGLLFVPVGAAFRLVGFDPLQRSIDRQAATYWQPKDQPRGSSSYFRKQRASVAVEFFHHVVETGQWWLLPLLLAIGLLGLLAWLGGTGAAPFIYTLW